MPFKLHASHSHTATLLAVESPFVLGFASKLRQKDAGCVLHRSLYGQRGLPMR